MNRWAVIRKALARKDIKQLIENFFSLAILKVFNLILPFVTLPYLIKTLGFERYGVIVLAIALMQYFQAVTDYGFNLSATRDIAKHRHSQRQLSHIYSKVMMAKFFLLIISLTILLPVIFLVPHFQQDKSIFILMLLVLIGHTLFPEWFFRGVEKMRYITILDLSIKLFFTIGVFLLIQKPEDYWIYPLLNGIGYVVVMLVAHALIRRDFFVFFKVVKIKNVIKNIKEGFPLFVNQFAPNLYNNTANFMVGFVLGNYAAGVFGTVRKVVSILGVLNSVVSTVFFPYLNRNKSGFTFFSFYYLLIMLFVFSFLGVIHLFIFDLLHLNGKGVSLIFFIMLVGLYFIVIYNTYSTNYLIINGYDVLVMRNTVIISIIGLFLNLIFINLFGLVGASLAVFMSQFAMGSSALYYYRKIERSDA